MTKAKARKSKRGMLENFEDFRVVLTLPVRLAANLRTLCQLTLPEWTFALEKIRQGQAYHEFFRPKGPGQGYRTITAPCAELKAMQTKIKDRFLEQIPVHFCRFANRRGSSYIANATTHLGRQGVFTLDLMNAYPSVLRSRVRANLAKPFRFMLRQFAGLEFADEDVKLMLEALCDLVCWHDRLPQGTPTSGRLLDLVCMKMDQELFALMQDNSSPLMGYQYTAYADDLTFSANGEIPKKLQEAIFEVIRANGFVPHTKKEKTRYYSRATGTVPVVTGLTLLPSRKLGIAPRKLNEIRARLSRLSQKETWSLADFNQAQGTISHLRSIYPDDLPKKFGICRFVAEIVRLVDKYQKRATAGNRQARKLTSDRPVLFTDGASRGNPGDAAIGVVLFRDNAEIDSFGNVIGTATNNQAEYLALIAGLERALHLGIQALDCYLDSELVVGQLTGTRRVRSPGLIPLQAKVMELVTRIGLVDFHVIAREQNLRADALANTALDGTLTIAAPASSVKSKLQGLQDLPTITL